ncbi:MAG: bile acid:sodium symporter family protein [Variovorax sp.]|nr:MAG: bile acid:sodium symporter family protein [Variovorax sp.]
MRVHLEVASQVLVVIFVLTTLFSVGLLVSTRQVLAGLQQRRSLALALCANFVVLPGAAFALCWALQLAPPMEAALLLVATAPGSPALLRLNELARGDQARAVGLLVLLTSLTVVFQPLVLPMLLPGLDVNPMPVARSLVLTVLLPLLLGLLLRARWPELARRLRPTLARLGNVSAVLSCFILLPLVYWDALVDVALNGGALLVLLLYLPLAVGAGWWLGGRDADQRRLLALCCGQGSMGAAFVIAANNFNNPHVIAMLLLILWASLALLIPLALVFRRQSLRDGRPQRKTQFSASGACDGLLKS